MKWLNKLKLVLILSTKQQSGLTIFRSLVPFLSCHFDRCKKMNSDFIDLIGMSLHSYNLSGGITAAILRPLWATRFLRTWVKHGPEHTIGLLTTCFCCITSYQFPNCYSEKASHTKYVYTLLFLLKIMLTLSYIFPRRFFKNKILIFSYYLPR